MYSGGNWDALRRGPERQKLYQYLDQGIPIKFYGPKNAWKNVHNYGGLIAFDGRSFAQKIREAGVVLMLHAETHLNLGIPTARIFDAAANGAIAISDNHKFIRENFGDNILYIDANKPAIELAEQIKQHYNWIRANPEKVNMMTKKAHEIFLEKFTLESLILRAKLAQFPEDN